MSRRCLHAIQGFRVKACFGEQKFQWDAKDTRNGFHSLEGGIGSPMQCFKQE